MKIHVRRLLVALGLVLGSTLLICGLLEIGMRLAGWNPDLQCEWMLGNPQLVLDADVIIIPRCLLDPTFYAPPAAPLILTIGDSFTQGFPVRPQHAYPAVLQRLLAARGVAAEVRNAGMGDSGPDQQLRLLVTRLLPKLRPAVVVWQLFANDVWDNLTKSVYRLRDDHLVPVSGARHWLAVRQRVFDWTPLPRTIKRKSRLFQLLLHRFERSERPPIDPVQWSLAKLVRELDEFERLARVHDFVPYVLLVPPQAVYLAKTDPAWKQRWTVVENGRIAALLQPRPEAIDGYLGDGRGDSDFASGAQDPQLRGDRHLNERGYANLAVLVARRLRHDGILVRGNLACRGAS